MAENSDLVIDRSIYPMPMFANLIVRDLAASVEFYAVAGFVPLATIPGPGGAPQLIHLRRTKYQDVLLTEGVPLAGSAAISFAAGPVDLDAVSRALRAAGAEVEGPVDTLWFTTDVRFVDPDGHRVVLTAPRMADMDRARDWSREGIVGEFDVPDDHDGSQIPG